MKSKPKIKEESVEIFKEFQYFSNAPIFDVASSLAICYNYRDLEHRLNMENYFSILICKN